jgi:hypothetical protein
MNTQGNFKPALAFDAPAIARSVKRIAHEIVERNNGAAMSSGRYRAPRRRRRTAGRAMAENGKRAVPVGTLDISSTATTGAARPAIRALFGRDIPFALDSLAWCWSMTCFTPGAGAALDAGRPRP